MLSMVDAEIPEGLRDPQIRGSEEERQRRIALFNINVEHLKECRRQLSDVLDGINDNQIVEQPVTKTIIIDEISREQREKIENAGKERGLVKRVIDDIPTEHIQ
jgi:hypothetical protein